MRPGQNKRMRGRNNNTNNRKGPNPLTRSYESNGPDVKIRGTAHHVAEKYLQLARDAQSSGDPVMAESYLQHAEHYFRLIAAAQQAQQQASLGLTRPPGELDTDDGDDDEDFSGLPDRFASPVERFPPPPPPPAALPNNGGQNGQQAYGERPYYNNGERPNYEQRAPRPDRQPFNDRNFGDRQGNQGDRNQGDRNQGDRNQGNGSRDDRGPRPPRPQREFRPDVPRADQRPVTQPSGGAPADEITDTALPAFITAPVRVPTDMPQPVLPGDDAIPPAFEGNAADGDTEGFHLRPRRRRRHRPDEASDGVPGEMPAKDPVGD